MTRLAYDDRYRLGSLAGRIMLPALLIGLVGVVGGIGLAWNASRGDGGEAVWPHFFRAYLVAFMVALTICLGAMFWTLVQHVTHAGWGVALRRLSEAVAANLAWIWILFLPILATVLMEKGVLYRWAAPGVVEGSELLSKKAAYLNPVWWAIRAVIFLGGWVLISTFYFRNSVRQDATGNVELTHRMQHWAPFALLFFALSQTFAVIDWIMTIEPEWFSTMFGVYFFAGSCCAFFAVQIIIVFFLQRNGRLENEISLEHYQDMGKLLFAFGVVFWAYIGYSQYMLIWYANIPEETTWYIARTMQSWKTVSYVLLIGHFALPFLFLVTKHTKRMKAVLAGAAVYMLLMHVVDVYWLVMPSVPLQLLESGTAETYAVLEARLAEQGNTLGFNPQFMDIALLIGMLGLLVAGTAHRLRHCLLLPAQDPRLPESLAFENM